MTASRLNHAIVIGASISGLLAARVLSKHFQKVTILERDVLPSGAETRKGAPQGRHLHVLLARGRDLLEKYFPGLTVELSGQGAQVGDLSESVCWFSDGAYTRNFKSGLVGVQVSRPLLEATIRGRVRALPNVTLLDHHDVAGLQTAASGAAGVVRVSGVRVVDRSRGESEQAVHAADLVVDASGRGSRMLAWLEELGYARPKEEKIKIDITYTTREFRRKPEHAGGKNPIVIQPSFNNRRAGVMLAVEGERWIAGLSGILGEAAPGDLEGYIAYARSLDAPDMYEIVKSAEPLGEAVQYKYPASQRRYFEKLRRFPEGLLLCGDVICSFNPVYGQGMTTAACEAEIIDELLPAGVDGIAKKFFQRAGKLLDSPWQIAAGSDLNYPEVEGKRDPSLKLINPYMSRLLKATSSDPVVNLAFQKVTNLIEPPASLFHPAIMARVLFGGAARKE